MAKKLKDKLLRCTKILYIILWIYMVLVTLPQILIPLAYIIGENPVIDFWNTWLDIGEHTLIPFIAFSAMFEVFVFGIALYLIKLSERKKAAVIILNIIIPLMAYAAQDKMWFGIIAVIFGVVIFAFTLKAVHLSEMTEKASI